MLGAVVAAVASVRHPFLEQQALVGQVEHPQPRLGGRPRVVDHAEAITIDAQLGPLQRTAHGVRRQLQHVAVGLGRTARQQGSQIIGTGGKGGRLCQRRGAGGGRQQAERGQPAQAGCSHVHNGEAQLPFRVDPGGSDSKTGCIPDSAGLGRTAGSELAGEIGRPRHRQRGRGQPGRGGRGTGRAQPFNDVAAAVVNTLRAERGEAELTLAQLVELDLIRYIPFPDDLKGRYQSYTQADVTQLRTAGFYAPMRDVQTGVAEYVRYWRARR
ncbi:hypothetical protein G6F22_015936 [Rhizopus arrhizus]|nr:hypothetical protein G6F22_015936 [Rhizopus arrhizus]